MFQLELGNTLLLIPLSLLFLVLAGFLARAASPASQSGSFEPGGGFEPGQPICAAALRLTISFRQIRTAC